MCPNAHGVELVTGIKVWETVVPWKRFLNVYIEQALSIAVPVMFPLSEQAHFSVVFLVFLGDELWFTKWP